MRRAWLTLCLVWLVPLSARAGNGDGVLLGNGAALSGGAVSATVADGTATWYNPAGLASIRRGAIDVSGSIFQLRAANEPGLISSTTGASNDGGYLELLTIPSASTISRQLEPGLGIAFGIFASRFGQNTVRTGLETDSPVGSSQWTLSSSTFDATYHAGGALGFTLSEQVRFGLSLFGVYRERSRSFQSAGAFDLGDQMSVIARGGISQVRSFGVELGLGVQWEPHPGVLIGFSGRSPGLELLTQVRSTTTMVEAVVDPGAENRITFTPDDAEDLAPALAVLTPGRLGFALGYRWDRGWIAAELDIQPPLEGVGVVERRFVWNLRLGARYEVDRSIGVGAGVFTDQSEQSPIQDLGQTRVDFYGVSGGVEVRTPHRLGEGESADELVFSTTIALRYAVGVGEVGGLLFDPANGLTQQTVAVQTTIHEFGLHIGSALYF
ncbi:MAG: hypothetical protein AB7S26_41550 [Sandaracinaceae bacterium]